MKLLSYYVIHTVINSIKKLFKTWVAIFIAVCVLFGVIGGIVGVTIGTITEDSTSDFSTEEYSEEYSDEEFSEEVPEMTPQEIEEMQSVITGGIMLLTLIVILFSIYGGDKSGTKIFTMPDVNFLFAAPIKPQSILMFRMVLQMGIAIVSSLYLLLQIPNLVLNVGLSIYTCLCVFLAYGFLLYLSRLAAVFTYTVTSTKENLKKYVRPFVVAVFILLAGIYYAVVKSQNLGYFEAVIFICSFKYIKFIPIFGWIAGLIMSTVNGTLAEFLIYLILITLSTIALTALIWKIKADFYEDAFSGANEINETLNAAINGETVTRKKERSQKIKRNSEFKGEGAKVFLSKTLYNRKRFAKLGIFSNTAITYFLISLATAFIFNKLIEIDALAPIGFIMAVCIFFRNLGNPLAQEMDKCYIYSVPDSPFKKLFYSILGTILETALDLFLALAIPLALMPDKIISVLAWYLLLITLDAFCSSVGLFTELVIPSAVVPSIKAMFALFIRMLAIVPGLIMLIVAVVGNSLGFIALTIILNTALSVALISVSQYFLHTGKK